MYKREKTVKEEKMKKKPQTPQIPTFSSSLLDEIYRSIDQGNEKSLNPKILKDRVLEKQSSVLRENHTRMMEENEIESLTRAYLVENWIEGNKLSRKSNQFDSIEKNPMFFSSSSSSLGSNSSLEKEIKIKNRSTKSDVDEYSYLENYHNLRYGKINKGVVKNDENNSIKLKSRALKIYSNLKKIKQPISPGGRLTTFINSLFNNGTLKKSKNPKASIFNDDSTCSSASSYTRSCMSRNSSKTNQKSSNVGKRTVSFSPMNVIIDENNNRFVYKGGCEKDGILGKGLARFDEDEDDDMASDSSSDLFELDYLVFRKNDKRYCEELPVYETTRFRTNNLIC